MLYINPFLNRSDVWAGVRGRQLVSELQAAGAEVITFLDLQAEDIRPAKGHDGLLRGAKRFVMKNFRLQVVWVFIECYTLVRGVIRSTLGVWRAWWHRRELCPDVVLARTCEYDWTPWLVAHVLQRPLVLEVHAPFYLERQLRGRGNSRLLQWLERVQWRRASRLWVTSPQLEAIIAGNGVEPRRIRFIPFGVKVNQSLQWRPRRGDGTLQIIFVGSFYPWHGIELLLKSYSMARRRARGLRLCLVGDGIMRPTCEKAARAFGVEDTVEFTGWLQHEKVLERLNNADIGVAPYVKLGQFYFEPVKVLDYMAAGLAIVASRQGRICDVVEHGESGLLVPPGDASALSDALVELAEDSHLRERLGKGARAKSYILQHTARRVLSLCEEAVTFMPLSAI